MAEVTSARVLGTQPVGARQQRAATPAEGGQPAAVVTQALGAMAQDGLTLGPVQVSKGRDGKTQLGLNGGRDVGGVPVRGAVTAQRSVTPGGTPHATVGGTGTVNGVPASGTADVGLGRVTNGNPGATINGAGRVADVPVAGTVDVGLGQTPGGQLGATVNGDVRVGGVPVRGDFAVTPATGPNGKPVAQAAGTLTTPRLPGARADVTVQAAKGLNAGRDPKLQAALDVGPEVLGTVRQTAAKMTAETIRSRQMPSGGLPREAAQGLAKLRDMNRDGQMNGAVKINVDVQALEREVAAGIDDGARDTTWRKNPRHDRPGIRNFIMNRPGVQQKVHEAAHKAVSQTLRDVSAQSGGVIQFVNARPGHTSGSGTYSANGVNVNFRASTPNAAALLR